MSACSLHVSLYLYVVIGLLCYNEWGASSSVIHPLAKSVKKLHAQHSSPLSPSHTNSETEVGCGVCVSLCARTLCMFGSRMNERGQGA